MDKEASPETGEHRPPPERSYAPADGDDRNRQERGARRRQQILDAAVQLFAANGYRATGVTGLAERVGMTGTGVLYYFGTKERLLREVVAERDRVDHAEPPHSLSELRDIIADMSRNATHTALIRLFVVLGAESFDPEDPLHGFFVDRYAVARKYWEAVLRTEQRSGTVRDDIDPDAVAAEIISVVLGVEIQWLMDPDRIDPSAVIVSYLDRLRASLAP